MIHFPVNHRFRPLYRTLAGLAGVYILAFGIFGVIETWGTPLFGRQSTWELGLRTNLAFSLLSVVVGAIVVAAAFIGRNVDRTINMVSGAVFVLAGLFMMALLETDLNLLNFTMATCIASFIMGLVFGVAGLFGKVGTAHEVHAEEAFRHGHRGDPVTHAWEREEQPHRPADTKEPEHHRFA